MHGLVLQERWDKTRWLISELVVMEREGRHGMPRVRMDYIRGFLLYVSRTYKYMTQYLKGFQLTLESWRQYREEEVWRMRGEVIKVVEI